MTVNFSDPSVVTDLVLGLCLMAIGDVLLFLVLKRTFAIVYVCIVEVLYALAWVFHLSLVSSLLLIVLLAGVMVFLFANLSEIRLLVSNTFKGKSGIELFPRHNKGAAPEAIFDRDAMYEKIYTAVLDMSRLKRGALITFMKKDNLLDETKVGTIIKQRGVDVNAPVTPELLETIFYEGTRLHDGAVIIKDDQIARAAVFFASTARPLTGKYGSRHQAAIGISENSDSVTVIVSEETGRISIAFQGELTPVTPDNFLRVFEDDMAFEAPTSTNNPASSSVNTSEGK